MAPNDDYAPPFQSKYFSAEMMSKYEPLAEAITKVEETGGMDDSVFESFEKHWAKFMDFSWCSQWDGKKYDVVFYGVSGYTGYLMMEYLRKNALPNKKQDFSLAFAGRSPTKVAEMRDREFAGTEYANTPILTASFDDVVSIIDMVKSAHVIVNCAGPYMLTEGEVLIDACVWCKTDYVDISVELPWSMRIQELHKYALEAGVMVVPSCAGNAYSDLGVMMLARKIQEDYGESLRSAVCYCSGGGTASGPSGGTLRTRAALASEGDAMRSDVFALGGFIPQVDRNGFKIVDVQQGTGFVTPKTREEDRDIHMTKVTEDRKLGVWRAPYVNAFFDTRVVRRSNMLMADHANRPYGMALNFMEYAMLPPEAAAAARQGEDETGKAIGHYGLTLEQEEEQLGGKPYKEGQGPSSDDLSRAWSGFFFSGESESGNQLMCSFIGCDRYWETARVAIEMALTLRFERSSLAFSGGVLTPSVAGGTPLIQRLVSSGVKFKMGSWHEPSERSSPGLLH